VSVPWRLCQVFRQRRPHSGVAGGDLHVEFNVTMQLETRDLACLFLGVHGIYLGIPVTSRELGFIYLSGFMEIDLLVAVCELEHGPVEIVDLPCKNDQTWWFSPSFLYVCQRVWILIFVPDKTATVAWGLSTNELHIVNLGVARVASRKRDRAWQKWDSSNRFQTNMFALFEISHATG
jgi:hypothetical protein